MGKVFSQLLAEVVSPTATVPTDFPVPAGYKWVVREVTSFNGQLYWGRGLNGWAAYDSAGAAVVGQPFGRSWAQEFFYWSGRQVLEESDTLTVITYDDSWSVRISGYALQLP